MEHKLQTGWMLVKVHTPMQGACAWYVIERKAAKGCGQKQVGDVVLAFTRAVLQTVLEDGTAYILRNSDVISVQVPPSPEEGDDGH